MQMKGGNQSQDNILLAGPRGSSRTPVLASQTSNAASCFLRYFQIGAEELQDGWLVWSETAPRFTGSTRFSFGSRSAATSFGGCKITSLCRRVRDSFRNVGIVVEKLFGDRKVLRRK